MDEQKPSTTATSFGRSGLPNRRLPKALLSLVLAGILIASGWWAGRETLIPQALPATETAPTQITVQAQSGTIGRSITLNATVTQAYAVTGYNYASGTLTELQSASEVQEGSILYRVNDRPIVAATGAVPFYRPLSLGDEGTDVHQLRTLLHDKGFLRTSNQSTYDATVVSAVSRWQKSLGLQATGAVQLGDLISFSQLPAVARPDDSMKVGSLVTPGQAAIMTQAADPTFAITLTSDQLALIPADATADVRYDGGSWPAVLGSQSVDADGTSKVTLTAPGGGVVCGDTCNSLPRSEQSSLPVAVTITPQIAGVTVPVAAIQQDADGKTYVLIDRARKDVKVLGSEDAVAVVEGISAGTRVTLVQETSGS